MLRLLGVYIASQYYNDLDVPFSVKVASSKCKNLLDIFERMNCFKLLKHPVYESSSLTELKRAGDKKNRVIHLVLQTADKNEIKRFAKAIRENVKSFHSCFIVYTDKDLPMLDSETFTTIDMQEVNYGFIPKMKAAAGSIGSAVKAFLKDCDEDFEAKWRECYEQIDAVGEYTVKEAKVEAAIVTALRLFFDYLMENNAVSEAFYDSYIEKIESIYCTGSPTKAIDTSHQESQNLTMEEKVFASICKAYKLNKGDNGDKWFTYDGNKEQIPLLCFSGYEAINEYISDFPENVTIKSNDELIILRAEWKKKGYLHHGKERTTYKVKKKERTAFIIEKVLQNTH